jgi:hypothetical protein
MALQDIINTAVNVEVNRSKLVAQNVSRSGRVSTASRNWVNPFRFIVTPKPVWTAQEYREIFEPLFTADRYEAQGFYLNNISPSTFQATLGNSWMINYQGGAAGASNNLTSYYATSQTSGSMICLTNVNSTTITAGTYIVKKGDYIRPTGADPYIATQDVIIPTAFTGVTGTIVAAGSSFVSGGSTATTAGTNQSFTTTATRTGINGISSTTGLSAGQIITKTSGTGAFGTLAYIEQVVNSTSIIVVSTTGFTAGSITFSGTGNTSTPSMCVPIHRGYMGTISTDTIVRVGARAALFNAYVTKLPQVRYLPGQLVELTGDIELIEQV